ncbi:conserved hypothetical protein [Arthrobacter sp. 9AX]|uniref:hypothetical protein n=1 Tax=Arthrobacter sp. 9AX TaxID=2653131 RepID=UPI0012F0E2C5|nr:hypothetical protein [Arthrobacter sp. 9AX]VXB27387.1 conserved hypothetical protein [Arthrobacter sp. 9AX]
MPPEAPGPAGDKAAKPGRKNLWLWPAAVALTAAAGLAVAVYAAPALLRPADSEGTLRGLQIRVLNISQAAAENRMDGALAALEALEKDLNEAAGQGRISLSRYRGIEAAVKDVRADITGQLAAVAATAEVPAATVSDTSAPALPEAPQQAQQVAPVAPPAIVPAPRPGRQEPVWPAPAKDGKEGKGKGKGKP